MIFRADSQAVAAHAAVAIRAHMRGLRRDGMTAPDGLAELADDLLEFASDSDGRARQRRLSRERTHRSRDRKRGLDVPFRKPGPRRQAA